MEYLFKPQRVSTLDRLGDRLGVSYKAAFAISVVTLSLMVASQQARFGLWVQSGGYIFSSMLILGAFGLMIRSRRRSEAHHDFNCRQLEIIVEGAPIGIGILDLKRTVLFCNSEFAKTYGFHQNEIRGVALPMPESQKEPWNSLVDKLRNGESFVDVRTLRERKDGTKFYATISGAPLADHSSTPFGLIAFISAAKDNLDEPLERRSMEMLIQSTSDFICVADLQGRSLFVNEAGKRLNAMRDDQVEGTPLLDFIASQDRDKIAKAIAGIGGGKLLRGEIGLHHFRTDASIPTMCLVYVIEDPLTGEPASIACVAQNLTHVKMLETQFRLLREAFGEVLHHQSLGVALVRTNGRVIETNECFQRMLGYSGDELRDMPFSSLVHPKDLLAGRRLFQELAGGRIEFYRIEKRLIDRHGNAILGRMTVRLMRDTHGQPHHTISIVESLEDASQTISMIGSPHRNFGSYN